MAHPRGRRVSAALQKLGLYQRTRRAILRIIDTIDAYRTSSVVTDAYAPTLCDMQDGRWRRLRLPGNTGFSGRRRPIGTLLQGMTGFLRGLTARFWCGTTGNYRVRRRLAAASPGPQARQRLRELGLSVSDRARLRRPQPNAPPRHAGQGGVVAF